MDMKKLAPLFAGWEESLMYSCLQGHMGHALSEGNPPASALITVGDFCFFAGRPDIRLALAADAPIMTPANEDWARTIEAAWGNGAKKYLRYAIKKEPGVFDTDKLSALAKAPDGFVLSPFNSGLYAQAMSEGWSRDFCSLFNGCQDSLARGIGIAALKDGRLVAGAASYAVYDGGIEIEIDTHPDFRRLGLAKACGAALIIECLKAGLYPGWDAHDLRSVALCEKLGYHVDKPYAVYIKEQ